MSERIETRLYVGEDLEEGRIVGLSRDHAHFLRSVLRLVPGDRLALFNGRDGEWLAAIDVIGKGWASVLVMEKRRDQQPPGNLDILFAPVKRAHLDFLVQKAVELGVSALHPVFTERTQVKRIKQERLQANTIEAAEQCERLDVPVVHAPLKLDRVLDAWPKHRSLLVCAESGDAPPIGEVLAGLKRDFPAGFGGGLMTGPEGGFSIRELEFLNEHPFVTLVGLGPRILRAETAAIAALAIWQAIAGDLTRRPPPRR